MKKLISIFAAICCFMSAIPARAENSAAACVIEMQTGEIVYEKNSVERLPMASTTKVMTCITALENCDMWETATVSANAANTEGSAAYIEEGNEISVVDLLYGLMLNSGNDAAVAIAEHVSGSVEGFVELMNAKAQEIGVGNTHFTNPNGLPDDDHYTTAYDLAMITRYAMQNQTFREIVSTVDFGALIVNTGDVLPFHNHNKLLGDYDGCIGVKTGYTDKAGRCFVSAAERDGLSFVAVTLNDNDDWQDHKDMLDDAFSRYSMRQVAYAGASAPYSKYNLIYGGDVFVPARNDMKTKIDIKMNVPRRLTLPVAEGEKVGTADFVRDGQVIGTVDVCSAEDLYEEPSLGEKLLTRLKHLLDRILL